MSELHYNHCCCEKCSNRKPLSSEELEQVRKMLAQLRQPEPPLTKAVQDMLREPGVVEQKQTQESLKQSGEELIPEHILKYLNALPPEVKEHCTTHVITGNVKVYVRDERYGWFLYKELPPQPTLTATEPPSKVTQATATEWPHLDGCPCEECAAKKQPTPIRHQECYCEKCEQVRRLDKIILENDDKLRAAKAQPAPAKDYVEPSKPWPQTPAASTVPSEEELKQMLDDAWERWLHLSLPRRHEAMAATMIVKLRERQPKREELSDEQIEKLAQDGFEMTHGMATWYSAPADARADCIKCVKQVLKRLKWEGRLL